MLIFLEKTRITFARGKNKNKKNSEIVLRPCQLIQQRDFKLSLARFENSKRRKYD